MSLAQEPIAHIRRCFGEHRENRGSQANRKSKSLDAQPYGQMLGRMRWVMQINLGARMRTLGAEIHQDETGIERRSRQQGKIEKTTQYAV